MPEVPKLLNGIVKAGSLEQHVTTLKFRQQMTTGKSPATAHVTVASQEISQYAHGSEAALMGFSNTGTYMLWLDKWRGPQHAERSSTSNAVLMVC